MAEHAEIIWLVKATTVVAASSTTTHVAVTGVHVFDRYCELGNERNRVYSELW